MNRKRTIVALLFLTFIIAGAVSFGGAQEPGAVPQSAVAGVKIVKLKIRGRGYFAVRLADGGQAYTRDGSFKLDKSGEFTALRGYPVLPGVVIPADAVNIYVCSRGIVWGTLPGGLSPVALGQFTAARFHNPAGLQRQGKHLYSESSSSGRPILGNFRDKGFGSIQQIDSSLG